MQGQQVGPSTSTTILTQLPLGQGWTSPVPGQLPAWVLGELVLGDAGQHGGAAGGEARGPHQHHARVHRRAGVGRHLQGDRGLPSRSAPARGWLPPGGGDGDGSLRIRPCPQPPAHPACVPVSAAPLCAIFNESPSCCSPKCTAWELSHLSHLLSVYHTLLKLL